jgi:endonuclease YncB( thermonuclease family)
MKNPFRKIDKFGIQLLLAFTLGISIITFSNLAFSDDFLQMREYRNNLCYDGDTCYVTAPTLPEPLQKMSVRILGIDTPEIRAECDEEKKLALEARELANKLFREAKEIEFANLKWDKYGGRVLVDVYLDGKLYKDEIINAGLARPYDGGTKESWCNR